MWHAEPDSVHCSISNRHAMVSASHRVFQAYLICQWIFLSSLIILFNKYLLSTANFHYPLSLVLMHMVFISIATCIWKLCGWAEVPTNISWGDIGKRFAPVALLFALSLCLGNMAYLFISVAFIQMLKASTPVAVLLASFALGLETPNTELGICIVLIAAGIAMACYGQIQFDITGVTVQMMAVVFEALRLCLVNIALTNKGFKLSPIAFLYFVAPLCACAIFPAWVYLESEHVSRNDFAPVRKVGLEMLLANAATAFALNLATMALIKHTSALTLNVSGVFKDILLIVWSVVLSGALVTPLQYCGYAIAIVGVSAYSRYKRNQQQSAQSNVTDLQSKPYAATTDQSADDDDESVEAESESVRLRPN